MNLVTAAIPMARIPHNFIQKQEDAAIFFEVSISRFSADAIYSDGSYIGGSFHLDSVDFSEIELFFFQFFLAQKPKRYIQVTKCDGFTCRVTPEGFEAQLTDGTRVFGDFTESQFTKCQAHVRGFISKLLRKYKAHAWVLLCNVLACVRSHTCISGKPQVRQ